MRKIIFIVFAVFAVIACNRKSQEGGFVITGTLGGIADGKIILQPLLPDQYSKADTVVISKGTFEFRGNVTEPDVYVLSVEGKENRLMFFLENSNITIKGDADQLDKAVIKGSSSNDDQLAFKKKIDELQKSYNVELIVKEYNMADESRKGQIRALFDKFQNKADSLQKTFIQNHTHSYFAAYALNNISYSLTTKELSGMVNAFAPELQEYKYIRLLKERLQKLRAVEVGRYAPDFTLNDKDGKAVRLSSECAKSEYLLVDFWASWCGPCRAENPSVVAAFNRFNSRGFNIISVSLDESRDMWLQAIAKDGLNWTHVSDLRGWKSPVVQLYAVSAIPSNFLVNKTGTIVAVNLRGDELVNKLQELLHSGRRRAYFHHETTPESTSPTEETTPATDAQ